MPNEVTMKNGMPMMAKMTQKTCPPVVLGSALPYP